MFAIFGAAGKVGYSTSKALRQAGMPVRAILRDESKAARLLEIGCEIAIADLQDPDALTIAISGAETVQVILPLSPYAADPAEELRKVMYSVCTALEKAKPKRILAVSDYGAHIKHNIGMPTIFRALEQKLAQLEGHKLFLRSAEHMQGYGRAVPPAIQTGVLRTFHSPADGLFPTISAPDVGLIAADLLLRSIKDRDVETLHAEGPHRYSASDVASVVGKLTGQTITVEVIPRSRWKVILETSMSASLAELLIVANDAQNQGGLVDVEPQSGVIRGSTSLTDAIRALLPTQAIVI